MSHPSETNSNASPVPLPRFAPNKNISRMPKRSSMSGSISVPANMNLLEKKKPNQPRPRRPGREEVVLELGKDGTAPLRKSLGGDVFAPRENSMKKEVKYEASMATQLPLVPPETQITSFHDIFADPTNDSVMLLQIPSILPVKYPNDNSQIDTNPLYGVADGHLGKIRIHKSGKVTAKISNVILDLTPGINSSCCQMVLVKTESGIEWFPVPAHKAIMSLSVDNLGKSQITDPNKKIENDDV